MKLLYNREILLKENVSLALFYGDLRVGEVVASASSRACAIDIMSAGANILDGLGTDRVGFLKLMEGTDKPVILLTDKGLGVVSPVFYLSSGLYAYAHIGGRRTSRARVLGHLGSCGYPILGECNNDPIRAEDIPTLREAEDVIRSFEDIKLHTSKGYGYAEDGELINVFELQRLLDELCSFCGVDASVSVDEANLTDAYASAGDMRTLVSSFLVCIAAAGSASADDRVKVSLGMEEGFWRTEVELVRRQQDDLTINEARRYLELTAAVTGMKFKCLSEPSPRPAKFKRGKFVSVRLALVHSANPDIGVAWGVKAGNILLKN